jgi:hypothetical protein
VFVDGLSIELHFYVLGWRIALVSQYKHRTGSISARSLLQISRYVGCLLHLATIRLTFLLQFDQPRLEVVTFCFEPRGPKVSPNRHTESND